MKLFIVNLLLFLSGQDSDFKKETVSASAKEVIESIEAYSAKAPIEAYSSKGAKVPIELPEPWPNPLNRMDFPLVPPMPPINPPPVTNVNP